MIGIDISSKATEYGKRKAEQADVEIEFSVQNALTLPFEDNEFDFVFDMGCFHHVEIEDRNTFIKGVHRVLKKDGTYLMVCFSYKNGSAWNHFTKKQILEIFQTISKSKKLSTYPLLREMVIDDISIRC